MKKAIFTLFLFSITSFVFSQTTYYWIGGDTSLASFTARRAWTTDPVGRAAVGTSGSFVKNNADIFIIDGANLGRTSTPPSILPILFTVGSVDTVAQFKVINGADVTITRPSAGTGKMSFVNTASADPAFVLGAGSKLTLGGGTYAFTYQLFMGATSTATISGTLNIGGVIGGPIHTASYLAAPTANSVSFESGSVCNSYDSTTVGIFNASAVNGIVFKAGSTLNYYTGRSPIGSNSTTQFANMLDGSSFNVMMSNVSYVDGTTAYAGSGWTNNKYFGNVNIKNGAVFKADGPVYRMVDLTIDAGGTFTTHGSGQTGIVGNIVVNGTLNAPSASSNSIVMGANGTASISGTGVVSIPSLIVTSATTLLLQKNIEVLAGTTVNGTLNFGTSQITGVGTFTSRGIVTSTPATASGVLTPGSFQITNGTIPVPSGMNGLYVSGPGVAPGTVVLASTSTGLFNISQAATAAATGVAETYTFSNTAPSNLITSNASGLAGSITSTGAQTFNTATNYTFNTATTTPFVRDSVGNVTLNAAVTTNRSIVVSGILTLNTGKLTIRSTDTVALSAGNAIAGGAFSSSKYIVTDKSGNNVGVLKIANFGTPTVFPVGSATNYLPATLIPTSSGDGFAVSAFEGITTDATAGGAAMSAAQKAKVVDAVWTINRTSTNIDNCNVSVNWPSSLEGSSFAGYGNGIGVARYESTTWGVVGGSGDNTANTATNGFTAFSAFAVGQLGFTLPVKFVQVNAAFANNAVNVNWNVGNELSINNYLVERSSNGVEFTTIGSVNATNTTRYNFVDASPLNGNNFYRIKAVGKGGDITYSTTVRVNTSVKGHNEIAVYPNPIKGKLLNLQLTGMDEGKYTLTIINNIGQQIFFKSLGTINGNQNIAIPLNAIQNGMYNMIIKNNQQQLQKTIFVQ